MSYLSRDDIEKISDRVIAQYKGSYTCMMIYTGSTPFEEATSDYTYCIFAYDEQNLKVRYIFCDSLDDGYDQPYYLTLDWE